MHAKPIAARTIALLVLFAAVIAALVAAAVAARHPALLGMHFFGHQHVTAGADMLYHG